MKKILLMLIAFFCSINLNSNDKYSQVVTVKCKEITGTERSDIFKIKKPNFKWYYKGKWYELSASDKGVAKDWEVKFTKKIITLYNIKTKWYRVINLEKMTAIMKFPTGEKYQYNCSIIDM